MINYPFTINNCSTGTLAKVPSVTPTPSIGGTSSVNALIVAGGGSGGAGTNLSGGVSGAGGGVPLRKNYAGIGFTYDPVLDAFYSPQPYPSWTLNTTTCLWKLLYLTHLTVKYMCGMNRPSHGNYQAKAN